MWVGSSLNLIMINCENINQTINELLIAFQDLRNLMELVSTVNTCQNYGTNLSLNKSAGKIWGLGINGSDFLDPHRLSLDTSTAFC